MFFYRFGHKFGTGIYQGIADKTKAGDIIRDGEYRYLHLGDTIARPEQGATPLTISPDKTYKFCCSQQTLDRIHRMVNERFTSYHKIIPLFLGNEPELLIKYYKAVKPTQQSQTLLLFPSLLSIYDYINHHPEYADAPILTGYSTPIQQTKAYRQIATNKAQHLLCTHSQMFQNRNNLTDIVVMDPESSYYHTFQDPRYNVMHVIEYLRQGLSNHKS